MDYTSYFAPPAPAYPFFSLPGKADHQYTPQDEPQNDPLEGYNDPNAFQFFDQTAHFNPAPITLPPQSPPHSLHHQSSVSQALPYDSSASISNEILPDVEYDQVPGGRANSSDDDKDNLTPAQSRRKAQNRAAQRAFRERKERHVKDLELKLKSIEAHSTDLMTDNERLKRELDRLATQNEILRATTTPLKLPHQDSSQPQSSSSPPSPKGLTSGPMIFSPSTFNNAFSEHNPAGADEPISHRIQISAQTGERLLATGAAWELIQSHELYRQGLVDIGEVCDRLKEKVLCDGSGPTFAEKDVIQAIEDSIGAAGDELI
ncbi:AP-1-like transcription factor [Lecanora helva]